MVVLDLRKNQYKSKTFEEVFVGRRGGCTWPPGRLGSAASCLARPRSWGRRNHISV